MIHKLLRLVPPFKGKHRISRLLMKPLLANGRDLLIEGKWKCKYLLPNLKESISFKILINGVYEEDTINIILSRLALKEGAFIDIGANIGAITIPVCTRLENLKTVCVEAVPWINDYLKKNIEINHLQKVQIIEKAISAKPNESVKFYSSQDNFGKGSMAPVFTDHGIEVTTTTIDLIASSLSEAISVIKIDIEGFEYHAFLGGVHLFSGDDAPDIIFEYVDWAEERAGITAGSAQQFLIDLGYSLFIFHKGKLLTLNSIVVKGSAMLLATKKPISK